MIKHILFNFASKTRPGKFNRLVDQIYEYCSQPFTILAKVDDDDPTKDQYDLSRVVHVGGVCSSKIEAINKGIPPDGWDIITDISDDFVFTRKGFDHIIRQHCGSDDYLHFPEPFADNQARTGKNERIVIMYCAGRDWKVASFIAVAPESTGVPKSAASYTSHSYPPAGGVGVPHVIVISKGVGGADISTGSKSDGCSQSDEPPDILA